MGEVKKTCIYQTNQLIFLLVKTKNNVWKHLSINLTFVSLVHVTFLLPHLSLAAVRRARVLSSASWGHRDLTETTQYVCTSVGVMRSPSSLISALLTNFVGVRMLYFCALQKLPWKCSTWQLRLVSFTFAKPVAEMACNFPTDDSRSDSEPALDKTIFYNEENRVPR